MSTKKLYVVGFGPGGLNGITIEAKKALEEADLIVGFTTYVKLVEDMLDVKESMSTPMGGEVERVRLAFEQADMGKTVALICSGDSSVYGMAGLAYELSINYPEVEIETIAGVTAALSGGALLGAAIGNDVCLISLSDYHTSAEQIERRLKLAAEADFVIALYNPNSKKRPDCLENACKVLLSVLPEDRICGIAENIGREGEKSIVMSLKELSDYPANMFTTVFIGNSKTLEINGRMVTPRGYSIG